jgi:hypothetical protein
MSTPTKLWPCPRCGGKLNPDQDFPTLNLRRLKCREHYYVMIEISAEDRRGNTNPRKVNEKSREANKLYWDAKMAQKRVQAPPESETSPPE